MNFLCNLIIRYFVLFLVLSGCSFMGIAYGEMGLPIEELLTPIVEGISSFVGEKIGEKIKGRKGIAQTADTDVKQAALKEELKKVFFGELEERVAQLQENVTGILQSQELQNKLKEQLEILQSPFQPYIIFPGFSLARGFTPTVYHNLFMYIKRAQQFCVDDLEQAMLKKQLPEVDPFSPMIKRFNDRIELEYSHLMSDVMTKTDAKKEGIIAPATIKVVRKQLNKPTTIFDEIVEGSVITLKSSMQGVGQGKYLIEETGKLKATSENALSSDKAQFSVERYGRWIGLKSTAGYIGVNGAAKEITSKFKKFAPETRWAMEGAELGSVILRNEKTGLVLSVGDNAVVSAASQVNFAAQFECELVSRPWNPLGYSLPLLKQLPAGTKIAFKVKDQNGIGSKYLSVDGKGFISASGTSSSDWHCQFYVMRFGNYLGFKLNGWKNICIDPVSQMVYVAQRSHMLYSATEQWVIDPDDKSSLKSIRLINRATGGYLCLPDEAWALGKAATAYVHKPNPIKAISSLPTLLEYIAQAATKEQALSMEIEIINPAPTDIVAGKNSFSFIPAIHGKDTVFFSENWKFKQAKLSLILRNVQSQAGVLIALSDKQAVTSNTVYILLGDQQNNRSGIRVFGSMAASVTSQQNSDAVITKPESESLWVRLQGGTLSFGKGEVFDSRQIASVQLDASIAQQFAYFALGGGGNPVSFGSISY